MKDRNGNTLIKGCTLQSNLQPNDSTKIIYKGDGEFDCPGGGTMFHDPESLLASHWVVIETPNEGKKKNG